MSDGTRYRTVCAMCGTTFYRMPCSIYKLNFAGKVNHFCCYSCYTEGKKVKEAGDEKTYKQLNKEQRKP